MGDYKVARVQFSYPGDIAHLTMPNDNGRGNYAGFSPAPAYPSTGIMPIGRNMPSCNHAGNYAGFTSANLLAPPARSVSGHESIVAVIRPDDEISTQLADEMRLRHVQGMGIYRTTAPREWLQEDMRYADACGADRGGPDSISLDRSSARRPQMTAYRHQAPAIILSSDDDTDQLDTSRLQTYLGY